ncbi:hypothetical protein E4U35_003996 [Claviceps purpurea]|nr:hypothetical protein E4U35_003996 [Claviceps purpurea]
MNPPMHNEMTEKVTNHGIENDENHNDASIEDIYGKADGNEVADHIWTERAGKPEFERSEDQAPAPKGKAEHWKE